MTMTTTAPTVGARLARDRADHRMNPQIDRPTNVPNPDTDRVH